MRRRTHVLAIDQGTTSTRAVVFDAQGRPVAASERELRQIHPAEGWVEHDPEGLWADTLSACRDAIARARLTADHIAAIGIASQRETVVLWDRATGRAVHNAIAWQDRRTAGFCRDLAAAGHEKAIQAKTGLIVDAHFSASKLAWLLDAVPDARRRAEAGDLAFGTVDSFLLWRLTHGRVHATDATNASRTMLFNIHTQGWDDDLLSLFGVPRAILPEVHDNAHHFGTADRILFGASIPITGMAGDQQAATFGQACFAPGMAKATFGTGCFALLNVGDRPKASRHRLLTTVAYRLGGRPAYAIEGAIFSAGASIQWLRDGLGIIRSAADSEALARSVEDTAGVYLVPAFTGLGAPHWDPDARGTITGLTRDVTGAHIARAALEAVAFQTRDLMEAMAADGARPKTVRIDGGMVGNDWLCQALADMLGMPVERPKMVDSTALGAATLAGLTAGVYPSVEAMAEAWEQDRLFEPSMPAETRARLYEGWQKAVRRARSTLR